MSDEWRDKIITEELGLCWHEFEFRNYGVASVCKHCRAWFEWNVEDQCKANNIDFNTPDGFFIIIQEGQKREWWVAFLVYLWYEAIRSNLEHDVRAMPMEFINPPRMHEKLSSWLKEHEGEWR